jgi:hypothetical protein
MPRFQLIFFGCFPRPYQVAQRLVRCVRHPYRRQFSGAVAARQFLRIPPVRLYPVPSFRRHQARSDHLAGDSQLRKLPIQHVPGRPGFIAGSQILNRSQFVNQLTNRFRAVRNYAETAHLSVFFGHRDGDGIGMDIETYKSYFRHERPAPFVCGSAPLDSPLRSVTRATANRRLVAPF